MKLIYRGTTYDYHPTAKARRLAQHPSGSAYDLIYRGSIYRFDPTIARPATGTPSSYELTYRGITYQVNRNAVGEVMAITHATHLFKRKTSLAHPARSK